MSGLTLAVAPRSDPTPPEGKAAPPRPRTQQAVLGGVMGSLRLIELQLVAFIMVFSASGLVPLVVLTFPAFATLYIVALSRLAFPIIASSGGSATREIFHGSRLFQAYVVLGTTVGLFLPLAYVLGGFARGDDHAVRSATPHLFIFSPPVRALVPFLYTVRRIFVIVDWVSDVGLNTTLPANAARQDVMWMWFGRVLALANLVYFSINLFGFLIPRFLPRAFERYFKERDEVYAKTAEDKRSSKEERTESKTHPWMLVNYGH